MAEIVSPFFKINISCFTALIIISAAVTFLAGILRYSAIVPEPGRPLKTPFGKLRFFDGIALYGIVTLLLSSLAKGRAVLWG